MQHENKTIKTSCVRPASLDPIGPGTPKVKNSSWMHKYRVTSKVMSTKGT